MEYLNRFDKDLVGFDPDIILWAKRVYTSLVGTLHWSSMEAYGKALGDAQFIKYERDRGKKTVWGWGGYSTGD